MSAVSTRRRLHAAIAGYVHAIAELSTALPSFLQGNPERYHAAYVAMIRSGEELIAAMRADIADTERCEAALTCGAVDKPLT